MISMLLLMIVSVSICLGEAVVIAPQLPVAATNNSTPYSLLELQTMVISLKAELEHEKALRTETQSQAAINTENIRRIQHALFVSSREYRDSFARIRHEQAKIQQFLLPLTYRSDSVRNITGLLSSIEDMNEKVQHLQARVENCSTDTQETIAVLRRLYAENVTEDIAELKTRVVTLAEHQLVIQSMLQDTEDSMKNKLKRKIRILKDDIDSKIRDYNAAMTTFASDLRILRQEVEQNINNMETKRTEENDKIFNTLNLVQREVNVSKDWLQDEVLRLKNSQQEELGQCVEFNISLSTLQNHVVDTDLLVQELDKKFVILSNMVDQFSESQIDSADLLDIKESGSCPPPYNISGPLCLTMLREHLTWSSARKQCQELARIAGGEGDLATGSDDTHSIRSYITHSSKYLPREIFVWVGASLLDDKWTWVNGKVVDLDLFPWDQSEPDPTVEETYLCIKVSGGALFHNCPNNSELFSMCQFETDYKTERKETHQLPLTFKGPTGFLTDLFFTDIQDHSQNRENISLKIDN